MPKLKRFRTTKPPVKKEKEPLLPEGWPIPPKPTHRPEAEVCVTCRARHSDANPVRPIRAHWRHFWECERCSCARFGWKWSAKTPERKRTPPTKRPSRLKMRARRS